MRRKSKYTSEELLSYIKQYHAKYGRIPSKHEIGILPSAEIYRKFFGSWSEAIRLAGFIPRRHKVLNKYYTKNELLNFIRKYYLKYHYIPISKETKRSSEIPDAATYQNRFGSWNKAIKLAGFMPIQSSCHLSSEKFSRSKWFRILIKYIIDWIRS